jgi:hypothetical protein
MDRRRLDDGQGVRHLVDRQAGRYRLAALGFPVRAIEPGDRHGLRHGARGETGDLPRLPARHHRACNFCHDAVETTSTEDKTLLLLDEAAALGRIQAIEDGVGYLAAYMNMIMVWQDLDQLERINSRAWSIKPDNALILLVIPSDGKY